MERTKAANRRTKRLPLICAVVIGATFAVPLASSLAEDGTLKPKSDRHR